MKLSSIFQQSTLAILLIFNPLIATTVIDTPGKYSISSDQEYDPTDPNTPCFQITVDGVLLDLQRSTITQAASNQQPGTCAISIDPNLKNITIINGILRNFTGNGVYVGDGCQNIVVENIVIDACFAGGIDLAGESTGIVNGVITNCFVTSCTGVDSNTAFGLHMKKCDSFSIKNAEFSYCDAQTTAPGFGVTLESCTECIFSNVLATHNGGTGISAGVAISASTNCHLQNFESHYNISHDNTISSTISGFLIDQSTDIECNNCRSRYNSNSVGGCYGFNAHDGQFNALRNCTAEFNTGATQSAGYHLKNETKSLIENSIARKNDATGASSISYGIWLAGTTNNACILNNNILSNHSGVSTSYGIKDDRSPSTSLITKNYAFNNSTNYSVTYPILVTLPVLSCRISTLPGLPSNTGGILDNISVIP